MATPTDTIRRVRVRGFRCLDDITLDLSGLTVLTGGNGTGKSAILEALALFQRTTSGKFATDVTDVHGTGDELVTFGRHRMSFTCEIEDPLRAKPPLEYRLELAIPGTQLEIVAESLRVVGSEGRDIFVRSGSTLEQLPSGQTLPGVIGTLSTLAVLTHRSIDEVTRTVAALDRIAIHSPFEVTPRWLARQHGRKHPMRDVVSVNAADGLNRLGTNLLSVFHALRNDFGQQHWDQTLEYARLGLGDDLDSVNVKALGGGQAVLWIKRHSREEPIFSASLSDGVLTFLAFVALFRLDPGRSLLAFDEPELHLHPALLVRVLGFFESMAEKYPVLLSTHSDRLLDALPDPAGAVRVCELNEQGRTRVRALDRVALEGWLRDYRGFGTLRAEGYEREVVDDDGE